MIQFSNTMMVRFSQKGDLLNEFRKTSRSGGYPSEERPWMKYWPETLLNMIQIPECTLNEYLRAKVPSEDSVAMHYYGNDIRWSTVFEESSKVARSLKELGFGDRKSVV